MMKADLNQWTAFNNSIPHYKDAHLIHHIYYLDEQICAVSLANQLRASEVAFHFLETCQCYWTFERWTSYSLLHEIEEVHYTAQSGLIQR